VPRYKVGQDWTWQLLVGEAGTVAVADPRACDGNHLDEAGRRIVEVMQADGRAGFAGVATQVGIDETTVRRRSEAMLGRGCIPVVTLAPASALGFTSEPGELGELIPTARPRRRAQRLPR
jgi:hypothetical protein